MLRIASGWRGLLVLTLCSTQVLAQEHDDLSSSAALKRLSVEELMNVEVTSVSRGPESLAGAAAAVAIVSNDDIRRSGALAVPDALRFVPGLHVARITANNWLVSSRGLSAPNSSELLVLSDTRSVYTPLFSGVFWDVQDYVMEDIDRIEVIRGPGAAMWGANAVDGVINITTKSAEDTQGTYLEGGTGTEQKLTAAARYGGQVGDNGYYRVFGKYTDQNSGLDPPGSSRDDWQLGHVGFRSDWKSDPADVLTVQGDLYDGRIGEVSPSVAIIGRPGPTGTLKAGVSGGNILGRWDHSYDDNSDVQLRFYYDRTHRNDPAYVDELDTVDFEFQHRFTLARLQLITWGVSYRGMNDRTEGKGVFALQPPNSWDNRVSGFLQDQISFGPSWRLTLGTEVERNDFSGFEAQPTVRIAWDVTSTSTLWGAVSRAVRVPTRLERDVYIYASDPAANPVVLLQGSRDFHSEQLVAYEVGYRRQVRQNLSFDLATFVNRYHGLASLEEGTPYVDPITGQTVIPIVNRNLTDGHSEGIEALLTYSPVRYWRWSLDYSYVSLDLQAHGLDINHDQLVEGATPRNQVGLQSFLDLPLHFQLDARLRAQSAIRSQGEVVTGGTIPAYQELDVRLAWHGFRRLELSVDGRNLLHDHHVEFGSPEARSALQRSVYGQVTWGF